MPELLVRVVERPNANKQHLSKGHVVTTRPDGAYWSKKERSNPDWRIISVPGLSKEEEATLKMRQRAHPDYYERQPRAYKLDVALMPATLKAEAESVSRKEIVTADTVAILACKIETPLVQRKDVIGQGPIIDVRK